CVVANAGTVMTGACDPIAAMRAVADRYDLWLHVDGSYGGFATLAPSVHALFNGMDQADSISLDPHKWLYLPVDCGCVLYRDAAAARATFVHDAEYTRVLPQQADEAFAYWDYGPELSRRFRALKVWLTLEVVGLRAFRESIEKDLACARHLESLVRASDDFEMIAPVELSIFCFRYLPARFRSGKTPRDLAAAREIDAINERLLIALQQDGSSYLSNAQIAGRFALRGCVMNFRTQLHDMEILLDDLRRLAPAVEQAT
ncbi:MAG: pyridoxal-dependent decarboxylase, partial [Verrucomicrobiota bacterium]|nr:pyridoxal-dependent decarboxylase [Verrucomicrobiota bacterium]